MLLKSSMYFPKLLESKLLHQIFVFSVVPTSDLYQRPQVLDLGMNKDFELKLDLHRYYYFVW